MPRLTVDAIGLKIVEKRGDRGIRDVAKEIGTSPATLSRVERGHLPDLDTFGKICRWLEIDPGEVLGFKAELVTRPVASIQTHFRKNSAVNLKTAQALGDLIVKAHEALVLLEGEEFASLV